VSLVRAVARPAARGLPSRLAEGELRDVYQLAVDQAERYLRELEDS